MLVHKYKTICASGRFNYLWLMSESIFVRKCECFLAYVQTKNICSWLSLFTVKMFCLLFCWFTLFCFMFSSLGHR